MEVKFQHRGREVSAAEVAFINALIAEHPGASRRQLSIQLCRAWNWAQPNGQLRDRVCRSLMLELHRAGLIELPPVRSRPPNNAVRHRRPQTVHLEERPLRLSLAELGAVEIRQVRGQAQEGLFDGLIETHHYLGYTPPVGEHLRYLLSAQDQPIACMLWTSAPRHLGPRDRFIGWSAEARRRNIAFIAYNARFLLLPWVEVPNLASPLLGRMAQRVAQDWERYYAHPLYYLETFVDPGRFRGTCYRAANWICLGQTTGCGKDARSKQPNRPRKEILGLPLIRSFRQRLCECP